MEVSNSSIASSVLFDQSASNKSNTSNEIGIAVLKKALDSQAQSAAALINALPQPDKTPSSNNLPPHLGQNVNTTA